MRMEEFIKAISYLGMDYGKEYSQAETQQMYEFLKEYNYQTMVDAVKSIIRKSKFAPKIAELIEECESCKTSSRFAVVDYMLKSGYFHKGFIRDNGEQIMLSDEHANRNYNKTIMWLERGVMPDFLKEDINYYYGIMQQEKLTGTSNKLLN